MTTASASGPTFEQPPGDFACERNNSFMPPRKGGLAAQVDASISSSLGDLGTGAGKPAFPLKGPQPLSVLANERTRAALCDLMEGALTETRTPAVDEEAPTMEQTMIQNVLQLCVELQEKESNDKTASPYQHLSSSSYSGLTPSGGTTKNPKASQEHLLRTTQQVVVGSASLARVDGVKSLLPASYVTKVQVADIHSRAIVSPMPRPLPGFLLLLLANVSCLGK